MSYQDYLLKKIKVAERHGVKVSADRMHPSSLPAQKKIVPWALEMGAALIATDPGSGKTHMGAEVLRLLHEEKGGKMLVVTELDAMETWVSQDPEVGEGVRLGVKMEYVRNTAEAMKSDCYIVVTNYERLRDGGFDLKMFTGVWLDEGNYVKNIGSETTEAIKQQLKKVMYKWIATATPCPNELLEIINYADVLGICDRGQILTRFFQRNSTKAGELTLHPQHAEDFYLWLFSWSVWMTTPGDIGLSDEGYKLPKLIVNWHEVPMDVAIEGGVERDGQAKIYADSANSLPEAAKIKKQSMMARLGYALGLIAENPDDHYIIWHHLEAERLLLKEALMKRTEGMDLTEKVYYAEIYGKQQCTDRVTTITAFTKGQIQILGTKPDCSGVGCNFQKHCHRSIAMGLNHSWDEFFQAIIKRVHRYGQYHDVIIDALYVRAEQAIVDNIKRKWAEHDLMRATMAEYQRKYGLGNSKYIEEKRRSFMLERKVYAGKEVDGVAPWELVNTDAVYEWQQRPENSVDLIVSSFPFGNHYEYTDKYNDFGHNATNGEFFEQMDYLIPELLRTLKPGRIAAIHLKNRIHYGSVTGLGFSIFHRFTHDVCAAMEKHGFYTMGFHYVPTCVVGENNQTYRLTYGELQKDSTKMGAGIPEEIWLFRKAPTTTDNAYADVPVTHDTDEYSLAAWQIDADAMWGSSGDRYLTPAEIKKMDIKKLRKWWDEHSPNKVYDYDKHVQLLKDLDAQRKLSRTWTTLPMRSNTPFIWNDVNRMHGLNMEQSRRKQRNHICPMPFDEVDRLIELYSNPGELVADPFGGLGTTGVRALKKGRRALLTELNETYATCAATYLRETEAKNEVPTLFDQLQMAG